MKKFLFSVSIICILVGCSTLYSGVVTITSVVDSAMKQWASLSVSGKTTKAIDDKVTSAHDKYRQAAAATQAALIAYKANGDQSAYVAALAAARAAAGDLVNLIAPLLLPNSATTLQNNLSKAKTL